MSIHGICSVASKALQFLPGASNTMFHLRRTPLFTRTSALGITQWRYFLERDSETHQQRASTGCQECAMTPSNPDPSHRSAGSKPDDAGNGTIKQKAKEDARDVKHEVGARVREKAEAGQHQLADGVDSLSDAIDAAASKLDEDDRDGLARYARELSSHLSNAAGQLEGRSIDELANDAKRLARNNPALFMLGSIAVGFGLSRFFKASAERDHDDDNAYRADEHRSDHSIRDDDMSGGTPVQRRDLDMTQTNTTSTAARSGDGKDML